MSACEATRSFLARFASDLSNRAPDDPALSGFAEAVAGLGKEADQSVSLPRSTHPITGYVEPLLEQASTEPGHVVDGIRQLADDLRWYQIFQGGGIEPALAEGLFAAQLAGPAGFVSGGSVRAGLFLLAPNIRYPLHCHAADELYFGLSGTLTLQHGWKGDPFDINGTSYSITPSSRLHSLQTGENPVLLAYVWKGAINEPNWWWDRTTDGNWRRTSWVRTPDGAWIVEREEPVPEDLLAAQV